MYYVIVHIHTKNNASLPKTNAGKQEKCENVRRYIRVKKIYKHCGLTEMSNGKEFQLFKAPRAITLMSSLAFSLLDARAHVNTFLTAHNRTSQE